MDFFLFSLDEIKNHEPLAVVNVDHNSSVFINLSMCGYMVKSQSLQDQKTMVQ